MGIPLMRGIKNLWNNGDEDDYSEDNTETTEAAAAAPAYGNGQPYRPEKYSSSTYPTSYGGSSTPAAPHAPRRPRSVPLPLRAREKNIYTLKPKSQDEAAIAADYLKTGSAVVLNLEDVDRFNATRIIDFMSGVCYGLDGQGHAMKLGETIFLFTPAEFEISSDETDYGENQDFFFKDVPPGETTTGVGPATVSQTTSHSGQPSPAPSQQAITGNQHPGGQHPGSQQTAPGAAGAAASTAFPAVDRYPWER